LDSEATQLSSPADDSSNGSGLLRFDRIKNRIVLVALLATLIPSLGMAWISYLQNRRSLTEKITQELTAVSSQAAREIDLWIGERLYDLKVFTTSYEVSENLESLPSVRDESIQRLEAYTRLRDYVTSVRDRSPGFRELTVIDPLGEPVASSADSADPTRLPDEWLDEVQEDQVLGEPYWDQTAGVTSMMIAYAIKVPDVAQERFLGSLVATLDFREIDYILTRFSPGESGEAYLIDGAGQLIISSDGSDSDLMANQLTSELLAALISNDGLPVQYTSYRDEAVIGASRMIPRLGWDVVTEVSRAEAFAAVTRLRNTTILIVLALLLGVGLIAYRVGVIIVRPLDRLTAGVQQVAAGDFTVDLPVLGGGEVGDLTVIFNDMVSRLRRGREELDGANRTLKRQNEELERLSITDGLTGLYNRRQLMEVLETEGRRTVRSKKPFSILMIDVDHFKNLNDTHGHLVGDEVLQKLASILKDEIREIDFAARYGGEEFLVTLPDTGLDSAAQVGERIRARVEEEGFASAGEQISVTVSIGVADHTGDGDSAEAIISRADDALYKAKRRGRNRVVRSDGKRTTRTKTES
jgi:diguanylate cyclase (GGDEF)-like protein